MRVDAMTVPGAAWFVWDCERCAMPREVIWVDDETNEYEQALTPLRIEADRFVTRIVKAKRIDINVEHITILINPIQDAEPSADTMRELTPRELEGVACWP